MLQPSNDPASNRISERITSLSSWIGPWRSRASRVGVGLLTIFAGVTAAFIVDEYRAHLAKMAQLRQARDGIVAELMSYERRGLEHAEAITQSILRWETADRAGDKAVPGYYRIPGATHPPTAAWDAAVSSGVASLFDPQLRLQLGFFYTEFLGVHTNYARHLAFVERELLPRAQLGAEAFYDESGRLMPEFQVHMDLLSEFGDDLRELSAFAGELRVQLESQAENE